jgi:16S rRNA processing protein RimM
MVTNAHILIGRITGAHGIRGAVKLKSFATMPSDIAAYGPLLTGDGRQIEILRLKPAKDEFIADLKDVCDRNAAEALQGTDLFVARARLPSPKPDEFYLADLIGKAAIADGTRIGLVTGIQNFGAGDLLELDNGTLLPVAFVSNLSEDVTLALPQGFLDEATHADQHH